MRVCTAYESPVGRLTLAGDGEALTGLWIEGQKHFGRGAGEMRPDGSDPVLNMVRRWLDGYFRGERPDGSLVPLRMGGSAFQLRVWELLRGVPYGQTTTYGALARQLDTSARAVGGAVGRNPISILVPCHRVVGADGGLTGYAGGLSVKRRLLELEAETPWTPA